MSTQIGNPSSYSFTASDLNNPKGPSYGSHFIFFRNESTTVIPDLNNLSLSASSIVPIISDDIFHFKPNFIQGGNGADTIYGSLESIDLSAINGGVISDINVSFGNTLFHTDFGNFIQVGNGEDTVYEERDAIIHDGYKHDSLI